MPPFASTLYAFLLLEGQQKKTTTKPLDFAFKCNILQLAKKVDSINFNLSISYFLQSRFHAQHQKVIKVEWKCLTVLLRYRCKLVQLHCSRSLDRSPVTEVGRKAHGLSESR